MLVTTCSLRLPIFIFSSAEREQYYQSRVKVEQQPKKYLSLIVDGMDQAQKNIPHFTSISKASKTLQPAEYKSEILEQKRKIPFS